MYIQFTSWSMCIYDLHTWCPAVTDGAWVSLQGDRNWEDGLQVTISSSALNFSFTSYSFLFLSRVEIIVRKKKTSHSTNPTSQTGSYYCVNRLHPSWNLCKGWFSSANSTIAKRRSFHIVCPIKLQCFLMNLQRNIAKNKQKLLSNFLCCC